MARKERREDFGFTDKQIFGDSPIKFSSKKRKKGKKKK